MKKWMMGLSVLAAVAGVQGALIVNGDFAAETGIGGNDFLFSQVDGGWHSKDSAQVTGTAAVFNAIGRSVQQVNAVTTETGSTLTLSFDWTPAAGAVGIQQNISFQLVGWTEMGTTTGDEKVFRAVNGSADVNADEADSIAGSTVVDLVSFNSSTGRFVPSENIVEGTAGSTLNYSTEIDLSAFADGFNDVSDYDYIGIKFFTTVDTADGGTEIAGSTLDNVTLTAIPEPSAVGMLGLGAVGLLALRRRFKA